MHRRPPGVPRPSRRTGAAGEQAQGGPAVPAAGAGAKRLAKPTAVEVALKPDEQMELDIRQQVSNPAVDFTFNWPGPQKGKNKCNFNRPFVIKPGCDGHSESDYMYGRQPKLLKQKINKIPAVIRVSWQELSPPCRRGALERVTKIQHQQLLAGGGLRQEGEGHCGWRLQSPPKLYSSYVGY